MPRHEFNYPKEAQNTVNRYKHQATYSLTTIHTIINTSPILNVSFNAPSSPFPITLPLIGQMGSFDRPSASLGEPLDLYLHGYVSSRIMNLSRASSSKKEGEGEGEGEGKGLPVCIAASKVDGLVLSLTPNSHNYNYRSAVLFGYANIVESVEEKLYAMELITNSVLPSRWQNTRIPPNAAEMSSTSILRVTITSGSAKVRSGVPVDEKGDLENEEVLDRVWTGVVPLYEVYGEPVPGPYNRVKEVPGYVGRWVEGVNEEGRSYAVEGAKRDAPVPGKKERDEEEG
ncbi:hypothetical protein G7Y89_g15616 [Cudoniella acicularis]|uniref:Flavin-nucleotide-binding protein n=1 Tax=Cudoniella acicularis TaxID=354080 RepID=A0A8H4VIR8_9HELO|nr:hypothetical protein G7Y89_g15616 [Cudoniella acicularis]